MIESADGPDVFYQLSPKAVRWLRLKRRQEAATIMGHELRELNLLTAELGIDIPDGERRSTFFGDKLREALNR